MNLMMIDRKMTWVIPLSAGFEKSLRSFVAIFWLKIVIRVSSPAPEHTGDGKGRCSQCDQVRRRLSTTVRFSSSIRIPRTINPRKIAGTGEKMTAAI